MCGIAGVVRLDGGPPPSPAVVEAMLETIGHPRTDGQECGVFGGAVLRACRLVIVDTTDGGRRAPPVLCRVAIRLARWPRRSSTPTTPLTTGCGRQPCRLHHVVIPGQHVKVEWKLQPQWGGVSDSTGSNIDAGPFRCTAEDVFGGGLIL